jgi:hypothetical protein
MYNLRQDWDDLAELDPYWAVLSDRERRFARWNKEEFFATGEHAVEAVMREAQGLRIPEGKASALDFGCGLGRLSRPLAKHFEPRRCGVPTSELLRLGAGKRTLSSGLSTGSTAFEAHALGLRATTTSTISCWRWWMTATSS